MYLTVLPVYFLFDAHPAAALVETVLDAAAFNPMLSPNLCAWLGFHICKQLTLGRLSVSRIREELTPHGLHHVHRRGKVLSDFQYRRKKRIAKPQYQVLVEDQWGVALEHKPRQPLCFRRSDTREDSLQVTPIPMSQGRLRGTDRRRAPSDARGQPMEELINLLHGHLISSQYTVRLFLCEPTPWSYPIFTELTVTVKMLSTQSARSTPLPG